MTIHRSSRPGLLAAATVSCALVLAGCASSTATTEASTEAGLTQAVWADGITVTYGDGTVELTSNGIPNHERPDKYALPDAGVQIPDANTSSIGDDPTQEQDYDFTITTSPSYSDTVTEAPLGSIGLMISGSVLFNPYEGDGTTVAMANNFYLTDTDGTKVYFVDACSGHPTPMNGEYHYHAVSSCVTSEVDTETGASHLIGVALDGFPIYGSRDINGAEVPVSSLDACNGITSPTPEFPDGVYHYVLPNTTDETSSIRCFHGEIDASQITAMPAMAAMPGAMPSP